MADNLTTSMCRLSRNLGASTSWNPVGLSEPVMGLLYLFLLTTSKISKVRYRVHKSPSIGHYTEPEESTLLYPTLFL
jgi:hypothetical protein